VKVTATSEFELSSLYLIDPIEFGQLWSAWRAQALSALPRNTASSGTSVRQILLGSSGRHHPVTELTCSRSTPDTGGT
jgi:hypothetical protein